jgi:hypothetical protein
MGTIDLPASGSDKTETCFEMVGNAPGAAASTYLGVIRFTRLEPWQPVAIATAANPGSVSGAGRSAGAVRVRPGSIPPPRSLRNVRAANLPMLRPNRPGAAPVAVPAPGLDLSTGEMRWLVGIQKKEAAVAKGSKSNIQQGSKAKNAKHRQATAGVAASARSKAQARPAAAAPATPAASRPQQRTQELHPKLRATPRMQQVEREAMAAAALVPEAGSVSNSAGGAARWQQLRRQHMWPDGQTRLESMYSPYHSEGIDLCKECQPQL